jgi:hypothetical protein
MVRALTNLDGNRYLLLESTLLIVRESAGMFKSTIDCRNFKTGGRILMNML